MVTLMLAVVDASLGGLLIYCWHTGQIHVEEPNAVKIHALALPDLAILQSSTSTVADFAAIRDQALFHNRRSFYQPPAPSEVIAPPDYELSGTMDVRDGKRIAFVKKRSDQSSRTLHVGDDLDGWRVQTIDATRMVVMRDDQRVEVAGKLTAPGLGLTRGSAAHVARSDLHALGGQGLSPLPAAPSTEARLYRPPPK